MKNKAFIRDSILFTLVVLVVLLFWKNNLVVSFLLAVEFLGAALFLYSRPERLFFLFAGIFGVVLETIGGKVGIWTYTFPNFITVPIWIFFCWGFTFILFHSVWLLIRED